MKPVLILKTGSTFPELASRLGDFEDWIRRVVTDREELVVVLDVTTAPTLPDVRSFSGVVITGSHAMVTDRAPWSEALEPWLRHAVALEVPVLGICYGHQLLAQALGGEVAFNPEGIEIGTTSVVTTEYAGHDPLFQMLPASFVVHTVHRQSVTRLPDSVVVLVRNDVEPHHAFRAGKSAWGVQFHPEFGVEGMKGYIAHLRDDLSAEDVDVTELMSRVVETPDARGVLERFFALLDESQQHGPIPS